MMSKVNTKLPKAILAKYPALETVSLAIDQYLAGNPVTAKCVTCKKLLTVTDIPEIQKLWVTCETGCTDFRESY